MKVLITEFMDTDALSIFPSDFEVVYEPDLVEQRERLLELVADFDALIVRNRTRVDRELLDQGGSLRVIGRLGVGLDNIDLETCKARSITVIPATGANTLAVAEYVITALLMMVRGCFFSTADMISGGWPRTQLGQGNEVFGKTLGLLGFGSIAREVAKRATALGLKVVAFDPWVCSESFESLGVVEADLDSLLSQVDILSLHVPLTDQTHKLVDQEFISAIKPGAYLINTARGELVDIVALSDALESGQLSGAVLDVFESEPLSQNELSLFETCRNLILTPHVAGVTHEANERVSFMIATEVSRFLTGERQNA